jgi:hypothetical protein
MLECLNGRRFFLENSSDRKLFHWDWKSNEGQLLLSYKYKHVKIAPGILSLPELSLLATLGWYMQQWVHETYMADAGYGGD